MLFNQEFFFAENCVDNVSVHIAMLFKGNTLVGTVVKPLHLTLGLISADVLIQSFLINGQTTLVTADHHIEIGGGQVERP